MEVTHILMYILSGYGVVSLFVLIKLLYSYSSLQVDFKVTKYKCEIDIQRLESKIEKHIHEESDRIKNDINKLETIQNNLFKILASTEKNNLGSSEEGNRLLKG